jgi:hypothetical protein
MIMRITPKITREATSKPPTTRSRVAEARPEIAAAVRIASTSTCRTLLSTNGPAMLDGRSESVMNGTKPSPPPASAIDSSASARASPLGDPSKPLPGAIRFPASRPSPRAMIVIVRK